jgi:hypothetical protein
MAAKAGLDDFRNYNGEAVMPAPQNLYAKMRQTAMKIYFFC